MRKGNSIFPESDKIMDEVSYFGLKNVPEIASGDNLSEKLVKAFPDVRDDDVIVIAQKIVSKAEGRVLDLRDLEISDQARKMAAQTGRPEAFCQAIIDNSKRIVEIKGRVIVTDLENDMRVTSAGIDKTHIDTDGGSKVVLLPEDADRSASELRAAFKEATGKTIAVIVSDSLGHPYRHGSIGGAIGVSGIEPVVKEQKMDSHGNKMNRIRNIADAVCAAANLIMDEENAMPVIVVRGVKYQRSETATIKSLIIASP